MGAVPMRWLNSEGDVVAYSDEDGALHIKAWSQFTRISTHAQVGGPEDKPFWDEDDSDMAQEIARRVSRDKFGRTVGKEQVADKSTWRQQWAAEPDPAEEDPVLTSIVTNIPTDVNAIYILIQRLSHVLNELDDKTRETSLARTKLQEAAHWLGSLIHAGGVDNDS